MGMELEVRNGCLSLPLLLAGGKRGTAFVSYDHVRYVAKGPDFRLRQLRSIVPGVLDAPVSIFQGVRDFGDNWCAYVGKPHYDFEGFRNAREIPADRRHVFVVNLNDRREVYNWAWVEADPEDLRLPIGYGSRYGKRIL